MAWLADCAHDGPFVYGEFSTLFPPVPAAQYVTIMNSARPKGRGSSSLTARNLDTGIFDTLPGGDLLRQGFADLATGKTSEESLIVLIGAPRLRRLGFVVPDAKTPDPELQLYARLSAKSPDAAHSRYNALVRRLISFERAVESGG